MEPTEAEVVTKRSVDVTVLPEEAISVVESVVAVLRGQASGATAQVASYEAWSQAFREWLASHGLRGTSADWGRESIYADQGE
jgi:hypothetical protein